MRKKNLFDLLNIGKYDYLAPTKKLSEMKNFDIASALMKPFEDRLKRLTEEQAEMIVWEHCTDMGEALFTAHVICRRAEMNNDMKDYQRVVAILNRLESLGRIEHAEDVKTGDRIVKLYRVVHVAG